MADSDSLDDILGSSVDATAKAGNKTGTAQPASGTDPTSSGMFSVSGSVAGSVPFSVSGSSKTSQAKQEKPAMKNKTEKIRILSLISNNILKLTKIYKKCHP